MKVEVRFYGFWQLLLKTGGTIIEVPEPQNLSSLLKLVSGDFPALNEPGLSGMLAIAVNGKRIPAEDWDIKYVGEGDQIEFFNAIVGG